MVSLDQSKPLHSMENGKSFAFFFVLSIFHLKYCLSRVISQCHTYFSIHKRSIVAWDICYLARFSRCCSVDFVLKIFRRNGLTWRSVFARKRQITTCLQQFIKRLRFRFRLTMHHVCQWKQLRHCLKSKTLALDYGIRHIPKLIISAGQLCVSIRLANPVIR